MDRPLRVLIADDHPVLAQGVAAVLGAHGIETVKTVERIEDVMPAYSDTRPDVVIMDIRFTSNSLTGIDAARDLLANDPQARIVFYSQFEDTSIIEASYRIGGRAFVTKGSSANDLISVLPDVVASSEQVYPPSVSAKLARLRVHGDTSPRALLDAREFQVFQCIAWGLTIAQIAARMHLSPRTVNTIAAAVKTKLRTETQADMIELCVKYDIARP